MRSVAVRQDVFGTTTRKPAWRLEDLPDEHVRMVDLLIDSNLDALLDDVRPRTVFNCVPTAPTRSRPTASSSTRPTSTSSPGCCARLEVAVDRLLRPRRQLLGVRRQRRRPDRARPPGPQQRLRRLQGRRRQPASTIYGKRKTFPCANLRLYSVYGPLEDSSRLIPNVIRHGLDGTYPEFVNPAISRDFVYVDDVTEAFVDTALNLRRPTTASRSTSARGRKTTIGEVAATCRELFGIAAEPAFTMPDRRWDVQDWYANIDKARERTRLDARGPRSATA